jgi:chorismate-pyruvate lyase
MTTPIFAATAAVSILASGAAMAEAPARPVAPAWPDTYVARLEVLALLQSLNANLLSHESATQTLTDWCAAHQLSTAGRITAQRVKDMDKPADAAVLAALKVAPGTPIRYRRVRLACGERVLSEADNWYLPSRLTPEMNRLLDETDTPFGVVVKSLAYQRHTLSSALLYHPLPDGWDLVPPAATAPGKLAIPHALLQHEAVLTAGGAPFSLVVETYTDKILPDRPAEQ